MEQREYCRACGNSIQGGRLCGTCYRRGVTTAAQDAAPRPPFEVRISIGGEDWDYIVRSMWDLAAHLQAHGPEGSMMMSGGAGGSYSVSVYKREIAKEQFRKELIEWFDRQPKARA